MRAGAILRLSVSVLAGTAIFRSARIGTAQTFGPRVNDISCECLVPTDRVTVTEARAECRGIAQADGDAAGLFLAEVADDQLRDGPEPTSAIKCCIVDCSNLCKVVLVSGRAGG